MRGTKYWSDKELVEHANEFVKNNSDGKFQDIRTYAKGLHVSKSALHNNFRYRLMLVDEALWLKYMDVANRNKYIGTSHGGFKSSEVRRKKKNG